MIKDYTIQRSDLFKGSRWIVFKKINKNCSYYVFRAMTKKECTEYVKEEESKKLKGKGSKKNEKQRRKKSRSIYNY